MGERENCSQSSSSSRKKKKKKKSPQLRQEERDYYAAILFFILVYISHVDEDDDDEDDDDDDDNAREQDYESVNTRGMPSRSSFAIMRARTAAAFTPAPALLLISGCRLHGAGRRGKLRLW